VITETELDAANLHALNACNPALCPVCLHAKALPPPSTVPRYAPSPGSCGKPDADGFPCELRPGHADECDPIPF
jgi:hypothetical protein